MSSAQDNTNTIRKMYEAFGRGEIPPILDQLTDDVEWGSHTVASEVPWYARRKGKSEVAGFFTALQAVDFHAFEPRTFVAEGDHVFVVIRIDATIRKTGRRFAQEVVHFWTFRGAKVARYQAFDDTAATLAAWRGQAP